MYRHSLNQLCASETWFGDKLSSLAAFGSHWLVLFSFPPSLRRSLLFSLDQRRIRGWMSLYPRSDSSKPATKAINVVTERRELGAFAFPRFAFPPLQPFPLASFTFLPFLFASLMRLLLLLSPLPFLPFPLTLLSFALFAPLLFLLKQRRVLRRVTAMSRFVGIEPAAEPINVVTESRDLLTLAPHQLPSFPLLFPFDLREALLLPRSEIVRRLAREPRLVPLATLALLAEVCFGSRLRGRCRNQ